MERELFSGKAYDRNLKVRWKGNRDFRRLCFFLAALGALILILAAVAHGAAGRPFLVPALGILLAAGAVLVILAGVQFFRCLDGSCRYCDRRLDFDKEVMPKDDAVKVLQRLGIDPGPPEKMTDGNCYVAAFECTACRKFVVNSFNSVSSD